MISIVLWLVFGWLVGSIAEWFWPPKVPHSGWMTVAIGVAGSVTGGLTGAILGGSPYAPAGVIMSVLGALLVSYIYRKFIEE